MFGKKIVIILVLLLTFMSITKTSTATREEFPIQLYTDLITGQFTGTNFVKLCSHKASTCHIYLHGFLGALNMSRGITDENNLHICPGKTIDIETALEAIKHYVKNNPENNEWHANTSIWLALMERYPCD